MKALIVVVVSLVVVLSLSLFNISILREEREALLQNITGLEKELLELREELKQQEKMLSELKTLTTKLEEKNLTLLSQRAELERKLLDLKKQIKELELRERERERERERRFSTVIRSGSRKSSMVAITIDDGFSSALVAQALRILREENVKCTFFPIGKVVENNPKLWHQVVAEGHELGNHTYSHLSLKSAKNEKQILDEIKKWEAVVENAGASAGATKFFRPPKMSGFSNARDAAKYSTIIAKLDYSVVLWSIDTYYGIYKNKGLNIDEAVVVDYVVSRVRPGDIVLLHFIRPDVAALRGIIRGVRAKGLEPVTLTTLLSH